MLSHGNLLANLEPGPLRRRRSSTPTTSSTACCRCSTSSASTSCSALDACAAARPSCSSSASTRRPRSTPIRERGVTVIPGAPPLWLAFSHFDDAPADSFATVRLALTGAAKMPEEAIRAIAATASACELAEGYGLTEASPVVTSSAGMPIQVGSVGKVLDGVAGAPRRRDGDDVARRRRRRDLGQGPQRVPGLPRRSGADGPGARPPTAGCAPATSPSPTTTATCTSSTGPRTSSSSAGSTSTRPRSRTCSPSTRPSPRSASSACPTRTPARR